MDHFLLIVGLRKVGVGGLEADRVMNGTWKGELFLVFRVSFA